MKICKICKKLRCFLEKFTQLTKLLHDRRSRQIPSLTRISLVSEPVGDKQGDIESEKMAPLYRNEKCIWCSRKITFDALCARIRPLPVIYPWLLRWVQHSKPFCLKIWNEMRFMRMKHGISQKPYSISESRTSYRRAFKFEVDERVITSARCWDFDLAILWTT